jgi:hypothetical protein
MEYLIPIRIKNNSDTFSKVDEDDYERCKDIKWYIDKDLYAYSPRKGRMHRFIMNSKPGEPMIDHINGDKLDNRKSNLRSATSFQNAQNKLKKEGATSKYIGVNKRHKNSYLANIDKDKIPYQLGTFKTEEAAALAYNIKALELYGPNAKLNIIQ